MKQSTRRSDLLTESWFRAFGFPAPESEVRFHPTRKWRFDWAWPAMKVAVEVNGGIWTMGRHTRASGYMGDREKINKAQVMGWIVLEFPPDQFRTGEAAITIKEALEARASV